MDAGSWERLPVKVLCCLWNWVYKQLKDYVVTQAGFQLNYIAEITLEFVILLPLPSKYRK